MRTLSHDIQVKNGHYHMIYMSKGTFVDGNYNMYSF